MLSQIKGLRQAGVDVLVIVDHVAEPTNETRHLGVERRWGQAGRTESRVRRLSPKLDRGVTVLDRIFARVDHVDRRSARTSSKAQAAQQEKAER